MLDHYGKLQIAVLVYFTLALPVAIYVCIRQGWGRHASFYYLLSLTIVRIVGAILRIVAETHPSTGVIIAAAVFSVIGLVPLILCFMGLTKRVNDGTKGTKLPPRAFQLLHLISLVALILTIVGASQSSPGNSASTLQTSISLRKAASILFLVCVIGITILMLYYATQFQFIHPGDGIIVKLTLLAAPFLIVRVIYAVLVSFENNKTFNTYAPNVFVEAFMQVLMEFIIFALYALTGVIAPRMIKGEYIGDGSELGIKRGNTWGTEQGGRYARDQPQYTEARGVNRV